jgi:ferric-dicitrate binding protein FerR (iron transport regulator)
MTSSPPPIPSSVLPPDATRIEQLLRYLDGSLPPEEQAAVSASLAADEATRQLLRDLAEQIVGLSDLEQRLETPAAAGAARPSWPVRSGRRWLLHWRSVAVTLLASIVVAASGYSAWTFGGLPPVRVARSVGATRLFSSAGTTLDGIPEGQRLTPGDTLESRATDAWITTDLIGGQLTIAGNSVIRVLRPSDHERRFELVEGSLWIDPSPNDRLGDVVVQTPTAIIEARGCLFDVRTSATDTLIRVHRGEADVARRVDGTTVAVAAGEQATLSLDVSDAPAAAPQPHGIHRWSLDLSTAKRVSHGIVLPPSHDAPTRLAAIPLLWREGVDAPLLLYAASVAAWRTTEHPVVLASDSVITFRGRMAMRSGVRVGLTTQRMQGVFAGKFEVTIAAEGMQWDGEEWTVSLEMPSLEAMNPQVAASPAGLEVGDIYAFTLDPTAKLQLTGIAIEPQAPQTPQ